MKNFILIQIKETVRTIFVGLVLEHINFFKADTFAHFYHSLTADQKEQVNLTYNSGNLFLHLMQMHAGHHLKSHQALSEKLSYILQ